MQTILIVEDDEDIREILSFIVKNAVAFHKGTISASLPKEGGLRFDMAFHAI